MNGYIDCTVTMFKKLSLNKASVTIEAAITLPVFLIAVLSIAAFMQYPITYQACGNALSDVARMYSTGGYIAALSGMSTVNSDLQNISHEHQFAGDKQIEKAGAFFHEFGEAGIVKALDEFSEFKNVVFSKGVNVTSDALNGAFHQLTLHLATKRLRDSGNVKQNEDPWLRLGIKGGEKGVDLSKSIYYGEDGSIEIIAIYTIKPSALFKLAPSIICSNRIYMLSWGTGVGPALREYQSIKHDEENTQSIEDSLWNTTNNKVLTLSRGNTIEDIEIKKLENSSSERGIVVERANTLQAGYDVMFYKESTHKVTVIDIFSLNPFLSSYEQNPDRVQTVIKEKISSMPTKNSKIRINNIFDGIVADRELHMVVPENSPFWLDEMVHSIKAEYQIKGIQIELIHGYGVYDEVQSK